MSCRRALAPASLLTFAALAMCAPRPIVAPEPEPPPVRSPEPEPEPEPQRWGITVDQLGWDTVPGEPPQRAFRANTEGWKRHEAGDWAAARVLFQEAVDVFAEYDLARYNLACALSREGQLDAALDQLTRVLLRDLPRFRRSALDDPDLANLRRALIGEELVWRIDSITEAWAVAMAAGTPTLAWREWTSSSIAAAQGGQGQLLRPGVWVDSARRFLPAMELQEGVYAGLVDVERQHAVLVTGARTADTPPQFRDAHLYVAPLSPAGEEARHAALTLEGLNAIEVHGVTAGARVRLNRTKTAWRELRAGGLVRDEDQDPPDRPVLLVTPDGSLLVAGLPGGWTVKNRSLFSPEGREIVVQSTHSVTNLRSLLFNADQSWAVLVGVRLKCTKEGPVLRHAIDRVDLGRGQAEALSNKEGAASALFGRDGALYLQLDGSTIRYATPDDDDFETLPDGVLLTAPMAPPTCGDPKIAPKP